ncbi:hypothetical protein N431DRAFT_534992 [Stipitochalara longipes BDJ]|nr:hypothetical protein N431DRAFT_534992 [Stipitochalara longipes BDJ]
MTSPNKQKLRKRVGPAGDPANTDAPGLQRNNNGPPGPAGNKKGPPTAPTTITTEGPATSSTQTPPAASVSATMSPYFSSSSISTPLFTPSSTTSPVSATISTAESSPSLISSLGISTSTALTPSLYYETSPGTSTTSLAKTTLSTTSSSTSSFASLSTGSVSPPNTIIEFRHSTLKPGQRAGIALGTVAGFAFILTFIFLSFKWRRGGLPNIASQPGERLFTKRGHSRWPSRSRTPPEIPNSLLAAEDSSRGSLSWDYRSTFARPIVPKNSRRSLSRSLRKLVRLNPLGQNPVASRAPGEGTSSRNSFASYFWRRSTASMSPSFMDVESPPPLPPLPATLHSPQPLTTSISRESVQSDFLQPPTIPAEVLPPGFHRSWCYRNSQTSLASEDSDARSFKSVPGWVKFHYPHRSRNEITVSQRPAPALVAPQAISPGSWLKAKILRRSHSTVASAEEGDFHSVNGHGDELGSTESPVAGPGGLKQAQVALGRSYESTDSLVPEKQEPPWEI